MEDFLFEDSLLESMEVVSFEERDINEVIRENAHALLDAEMDLEEILHESTVIVTEASGGEKTGIIKRIFDKIKEFIKKFINWVKSLMKKTQNVVKNIALPGMNVKVKLANFAKVNKAVEDVKVDIKDECINVRFEKMKERMEEKYDFKENMSPKMAKFTEQLNASWEEIEFSTMCNIKSSLVVFKTCNEDILKLLNDLDDGVSGAQAGLVKVGAVAESMKDYELANYIIKTANQTVEIIQTIINEVKRIYDEDIKLRKSYIAKYKKKELK